MVYDKETLESRPQFSFSHTELAHIYEAAKADEDVSPKTLEKLKALWSFARTKDAYSTDQRKGATVITAS